MKNIEEEKFLKAAGAIYAWMCVSDGKITVDESEGFTDYLTELPYVNNTTHKDFLKSFQKILQVFEKDFDEGYKMALSQIKEVKMHKQACLDLVKIARRAMVIDEKLEEVEENVIREICTVLGVSEDEIS